MAFTKKDRDELARIRRRVAELEVEERAAIDRCAGIMLTAGLELADSLANVPENWAEVFWMHADAIRDALEPLSPLTAAFASPWSPPGPSFLTRRYDEPRRLRR